MAEQTAMRIAGPCERRASLMVLRGEAPGVSMVEPRTLERAMLESTQAYGQGHGSEEGRRLPPLRVRDHAADKAKESERSARACSAGRDAAAGLRRMGEFDVV